MEKQKTIIEPLSPTQLGIISIIKSAIKSTKEALPDGFKWDEAQRIILNQKIEGLVYFGLKNMDVQIPIWLENSFMREVAFLSQLWNAAEDVMKSFDEKGIEYIPLKGIKSKGLYPNKFMRHMSDVDIFIRKEEYEEKVKPIMRKLGWNEGSESDHELHWHKGILMIELHKQLWSNFNADWNKIVNDPWLWLKDNDDGFTFEFIHFTKHYRAAGIGINHLVEMYVCWEDIDLSMFKLSEFLINVRKTLDFWFDDGSGDEKTLLITNTVFSCGEYGTRDRRKSAGDIELLHKSNGNVFLANITKILNIVFPSMVFWKVKFPILKKAPFLLPFCFTWRTIIISFKAILNRDIDVKVESQADYENQLKFVGLTL